MEQKVFLVLMGALVACEPFDLKTSYSMRNRVFVNPVILKPDESVMHWNQES